MPERGADVEPSSSQTQDHEGLEQLAIYVAAGVSLIILGIFLRTTILNWLVGPAYVVTFVVLANRWLDHWRSSR